MTILHKSAKGKVVDMNRLASQNELMVAVSNVRINARGDELGPGGQIIRNQPAYESLDTGIPVEQARVVTPIVATSKPVAKPAIVELPNALTQPAVEVKETTDKPNTKGKQ